MIINVNVGMHLTAWQRELLTAAYDRAGNTRRRTGSLAAYPSRVEHARARRLATERNRRNRRRRRAGLPSVVSPPWSPHARLHIAFARRNGMTTLMQELGAAAAAAGESLRRLGETFAAQLPQMAEHLAAPSMAGPLEAAIRRRDITHYDRYRTTEDETTSRDSQDCSSSSGGRWSDLMAQIDDLVGSDLEPSDA